MPRRWLFTAVCFFAAPLLGQAQFKEATVIFKDGFHVNGRVRQKSDFIVDPASGRSFPVPASGGIMYLEDFVRKVHFVPGQVYEILEKKLYSDLVTITRYRPRYAGSNLRPEWKVAKITDWDEHLQRYTVFQAPRGQVDIKQRITLFTPKHTCVDAIQYNWTQCYDTKELGVETVRKLLYAYYNLDKKMPESQKKMQIARFLYQAGWLDQTERELDLAAKFPDAEKSATELRDKVHRLRDQLEFENIARLYRIGQHREASIRIQQIIRDGRDKKLDEKTLVRLHGMKQRLESTQKKMEQVSGLLKRLPGLTPMTEQPFWTQAANTILDELNEDSCGRLDTFLTYAQLRERDLKNGRTPGMTLDEVLSLAVTGWLLGDISAEPNAKTAVMLWRTRLAVMESQKTADSNRRAQLGQYLKSQDELAPDLLMRVVRMLPPVDPPLEGEMSTAAMPIELTAGTSGVSYLVQLPPDYHVHREYPVMIMLNGAREGPGEMLARVADYASQRGYILVAPKWLQGFNSTYDYSAAEHAKVLGCLRDLRRRFQIDSDRVFLFGWEEGAEAAYDIGLSHPHEFAGVLPMCGAPNYFSLRYWTNAQYLPFYVVEGEMNGTNPKIHRGIFKDWLRYRYPCFYVEYRGRMSEWFEGEFPSMFDWMDHKKRAHPAKMLGRYHSGGGLGEEFRTHRDSDNQFYWLSTDTINPRNLNSKDRWAATAFPATLQANIVTGNQLDVKAGGEVKGAKIWSQVNVRVKGVRQVSVWLSPKSIDFKKPVVIRLNGQQVGQPREIPVDIPMMLEHFYSTGDRERLFLARLDMRF